MKLCIAGTAPHMQNIGDLAMRSTALLDSFLDFAPDQAPLCKGRFYMLDSGAFSFITGKARLSDLDAYVDRYLEFVRRHGIEHYFELDLDYALGLERVKEIARRMEQDIGIPPIPVWHMDRGKHGFVEMCDRYDYVAVGGLAHQETPGVDLAPYLPWFIETAHARGCKIHGLGFTRFQALRLYHFDSVDSTSWMAMTKFHSVGRFDEGRGRFMKIEVGRGMRHDHNALERHAMTEWLKAQKWAETNL